MPTTPTRPHSPQKGQQVTPTRRGAVIHLFREKTPVREIETRTGVPKSTAHDIIQVYKKTGSKYALPRSGRPPMMDDRAKRLLASRARRARRAKLEVLGQPFGISASTTRRALASLGYRRRIARQKPFLTHAQRIKRVRWAVSNARTDWTKVLFTDECSFQVGQTAGRVWITRRPKEAYLQANLRPKLRRGPGSVMIWGAVAHGKKWPLFRFPLAGSTTRNGVRTRPETVTAAKYADWIIGQRLGGYSNEVAEERGPVVRTVEDGAAIHTAALTQRARNRAGIIPQPHPANSPDLNPIENIWAVLKMRVRRIRPVPRTADQLWAAIQTEWDRIPVGLINRRINTMSERVRAVKRAGGGSTPY